jgi:LPXTG-motif cell wall-anchored protein
VGWPYRAFLDPFQGTPGFSPTEGSAEAVVRDGRITRLTLVESPTSVQRQRSESDAALARFVATARASLLEDGPRLPLSGPPRAAAAEPTGTAWPLALGGLALLAGGTVALRRRRGGNGAAERNRTPPGDRMQP